MGTKNSLRELGKCKDGTFNFSASKAIHKLAQSYAVLNLTTIALSEISSFLPLLRSSKYEFENFFLEPD